MINQNIPQPVDVSTADCATPSTNTAAVITYDAEFGQHYLTGIGWSYSGTPTGGKLFLLDGTDCVFSVDIPASGPMQITFPQPKVGSPSTDMVISLTAGGSGVTGKVNALNHWVQ